MAKGIGSRPVTDEPGRKIGVNEAMFREVNERIEDVAGTFGLRDRPLELICECGDAACTQHIALTVPEYEELRKEPTFFAVYPGHEIADIERLVERRDGYDVIQKHKGEPARIARETHPRD
jgi:hypothetical protein